MTDTHTHLYDEPFKGEEDEAVKRAIAAGVHTMVLANVDAASMEPIHRLHEAFPENTKMAIGVHPTELGLNPDAMLDMMEEELRAHRDDYAAVGEVGLDLHWPDSPALAEQQRTFERQLGWGVKFGLPVIIHSRDARDETLESIGRVRQASGKLPVMIFHSFTGTPEDVAEIRKVCDPYFGVNGVVTFKNAPKLREALPLIGTERLVLETDAPYLAPVPHRGERNESAYIPMILDACAKVLDIPPDRLEEVTDRNAALIFNS